MQLTWPQAIRRRAGHHLLEPAPAEDLVNMASDICMRAQGVTRQDVRDALWRRRTLVKTVGLCGTLHLIPAGEVPMRMAANRLRFQAEEKRLASAGLASRELHEGVDAIGEIVGPEPITRPDFERELEARVGGWTVTTNPGWMGNYRNWPLAMGWAAALGLVCYGPTDGGRSTFVRLTDWSGWRRRRR